MLKYLSFLLLSLTQGFAVTWTLQTTPFQEEVEGAFVGQYKNHVIIAGGQRETEEIDTIYVLEISQSSDPILIATHKLPEKLAFGASVSTDKGLFCIGGISKQKPSKSVYLIQFDLLSKSVQIKTYEPLPFAIAYASSALIDRHLYLLGGVFSTAPIRANPYYLMLNLDFLTGGHWKIAGYFPSAPRIFPALSVQSNGLQHCLYVFGGKNTDEAGICSKECFCLDPVLQKWSEIAELPSLGNYDIAQAVGSNMVLVGTDAFYLYNTVTNQWHFYSDSPVKNLTNSTLLQMPDQFTLMTLGKEPNFARCFLSSIKTNSNINYILLGFYVLLLLAFAYLFSKRRHSSEDYFKGGYRVPWWAAGLSIFGTVVNSLYFMVSPAKAFASDWQYLMLEMTLILVAPIIIYGFIPFYRRLEVSTAYEYLEKRFDFSIRILGSSIFIIFEVLRIGIYLYLPALILSLLTGLSMVQCIICMGLLSIIYVSLGGIEAVIWSDILQVLVLVGGAIITFSYICYHYYSDLGMFYQIALSEEKIRIFDFSFDFSRPTFWVILLAGISFDIMDYGTDQITVQRYLTTKDEKSAVKSLWLNIVLCSIGGVIFFSLGTALFALYKLYPEKIDPTMPIIDGVLPSFIVTELPQGVSGLLMTGIFVAAMSSIHSGINGISSALTNDFFRPLLCFKKDIWTLRLAKISTAAVGFIGICVAIVMTKLKIISLLDHYIVVVGFTLCGLSGIFLLGIFTTVAHKKGVILGCFLTLITSLLLSRYTNFHSMLHMFFSTMGVFIFGYFCSLLIPYREKTRREFTIYHLVRRSQKRSARSQSVHYETEK